MNEFEKHWQDVKLYANMTPEAWCKNGFLAGAAAMKERCAEVAEELDIVPKSCNEYGELTRKYDCWLNGVFDAAEQIAAAIRRLEI